MDHNNNSKPNESAELDANSAADDRAVRGDGTGASSEANRNSKDAKRPGNELLEWIKALAIAGVLVFVIRWFLVSPFIVDGPSMEPNFWDRERIIVNKIIYDIREPKRGEVIVFHVPQEGRDFIKRVIALPGETVKVEGDQVYINGEPLAETYLQEAYDKAHSQGVLYNRYDGDRSNFPNSSFPDGVVPEGTVFVMGDNRPNSEDSRMIGYVSMDEIVGRADLIFWPIPDFKLVKH
ncbi:signal peptidase I [Cohnella sp. CIP 111063]|uniref:signal peptidase I n=1 Tax=unclassified Cohnella TaxID=2636738 RepID=UPI000B8C6821|nr:MULTISPECIES: signal peptidase I [unclassified Cohnella]OXS52607.1 signal peptidase I [Cohnella sp. CIP 111063]PRX58869.1 signal peptidase I [Cohnella sp. SGD-V74]